MRPHRLAGLLVLLALLPTHRVFAQAPNPADGPVFVARDVEPVLENTVEVQQALGREYPESMRLTGHEATIILWLFVEKDGTVGASQVLKSSEYPAFDEAATKVAETHTTSTA